MTSHKAKREAFAIVPETCPAVNAALANITAAVETADGLIKEQTEALRNALLDALDRAIDAEELAERLKRQTEVAPTRSRALIGGMPGRDEIDRVQLVKEAVEAGEFFRLFGIEYATWSGVGHVLT